MKTVRKSSIASLPLAAAIGSGHLPSPRSLQAPVQLPRRPIRVSPPQPLRTMSRKAGIEPMGSPWS